MDEKEILKFWKENKIFEKSLAKDSPKGEYVFYDGPPFATGIPHYGSLLASITKDLFGRYKTMRGYHVRRRWGWDCHGLPIENMIEKNLGLKTKKDIEAVGVKKFNQVCRAAVLETADTWKEYVERVGRWVDFDNSYKTMDTSYMESVWWALKQIWDKKLIYEGRKVLMYCPRCETPLSKAEVAMDNSYKTVSDEAITVKFKVKNPAKHNLPENTYLLVWTTTPWTLPSNVALAVNKDVEYKILKQREENLISAKGEGGKISGKKIIGLEYEPIYEIAATTNSGKKAYYVVAGDFVSTEEGTGIVHIAPMYGEDDYNLGLNMNLPMIPLLDQGGHFTDDAPEFLRGQYFKKAGKLIVEDLNKKELLFAKAPHTHSYPHCHRCETPLYYNALSSWFIDIKKIKDKLIELNEKINWQPEHIKHGRFLNILKNAPDWNISRNRYWASPLPIWKCRVAKSEKQKAKNNNTEIKKEKNSCGNEVFIGSIKELKKNTKKSGNKYFAMRHGESESNVMVLVSSNLENSHKYPLTEKGRKQVIAAAEKLKKENINLIFYSEFYRTKETASLVAEKIGVKEENIFTDKRIIEVNGGIFEGRPVSDYHAHFDSKIEKFYKTPPGGENLNDLKKRTGDFLYEIEKRYSDKNILIISHEYPIWMLYCAANGLNEKEAVELKEKKDEFINTGDFLKFDFLPLPHDNNFTLDLHRPYIDEVELTCSDCGGGLKRVTEVLDGWFESGAMPFAEYHYPFENKKTFKKRFPGDFVAEYIAQTRTWFYYMHAIAAMLFGDISFKNVVTTGNILAEDGNKMSKSKGNYTDPMANMDKFGADTLRYYLMANPVMQAEDVRFRDDELKESRNKIINILWNSFKFFDLYQKDYGSKTNTHDSDNVLDKWILARLNQFANEVTDGLEKYDTVRASRPIQKFIEDFSTWYIRRSRDRVRGDDGKPASPAGKDKQFALATMKHVLIELSKITAPIMPFIAEAIYRGCGGEKESVHLESWPSASLNEKLKTKSEKLSEDMKETRRIVSLGLEARAKANIKIRQPLKKLKIKNEKLKIEEFLNLIKDELNVKEVIWDDKISSEVELDTIITPNLKEEGDLREFVRALQDARKKSGLKPDQKVVLQIQTNSIGQKFLQKFESELKKSIGAKKIKFAENLEGEEIKIGERAFVVKIN